ncbi:MAG: hypothetical protein LBC93_05010 [Synergistaceae bacterium]|nr:hypothetical protein [Synergistaceae bacterium]
MHISVSFFTGLSIWIFGLALMLAGWLIDVIFENYGIILSKVLYKLGAFIVAAPVIYLLWQASRLVYVYRLEITLFLRRAIEEAQILLSSLEKAF